MRAFCDITRGLLAEVYVLAHTTDSWKKLLFFAQNVTFKQMNNYNSNLSTLQVCVLTICHCPEEKVIG